MLYWISDIEIQCKYTNDWNIVIKGCHLLLLGINYFVITIINYFISGLKALKKNLLIFIANFFRKHIIIILRNTDT